MSSVSEKSDVLKITSLFVCALVASFVASFFISPVAVGVFAITLAALVGFVARPAVGVYVLAGLAPMSGLVIDFSREPSLSRIPYLGTVNAPLVDFVALLLLVTCALLVIFRPHALHWSAVRAYAGVFLFWFLAIALSVYFSDQIFFGTTIKAFARPYLFSVLGFALPIVLLLRSREEIKKSLYAYEAVCVGGAFLGLVSFFVLPAVGFFRASPFAIFGFTPFGINHNVLAEALTAIIPFAWYAVAAVGDEHKNTHRRTVAIFAATLITVIALASVSRAAWIVVALQCVCWILYRYQHRHHHTLTWFLILFATIGMFFTWISSTTIAEGSDATRSDLAGIALMYFQRAPWFGQGPGMFVPLVTGTKIFQMQYGDALDAHGIFEKLLPEIGIIGTATFLLLIGSIAAALWRRRRDPFQYMLFVTFASVWVYQLFNTGYFAGKVWVLVGLMLAALCI